MKANCVSLLLLSTREKELIEQTHDVGQRHSISPFYHQTSPDAKINLHHDSSSSALKTHTTISTPSPTVSHNRILVVDDDPDIATLFS